MHPNKSISFVDFYKQNKVSPVNQNIGSLTEHLNRRVRLFHSLGISKSYIKNSKLIEFGPGSGYNTLVFSLINKNYIKLVDGNPYGLEKLISLYKKYELKLPDIEYMYFEDFNENNSYDIAWAEGCIPQQKNPIAILKSISKTVHPGGSLVVTAISGVSYMSEIFRRIVTTIIVEGNFHKDLKYLGKFFSSHLSELSGMTRPAEDWIIDSLLNPLHEGKLLSIPDILNTLDQFEFISSLPTYLHNWIWYKDQDQESTSKKMLSQYYSTNLCYLDKDIPGCQKHSQDLGKELETAAELLWDTMCYQQSNNENVYLYGEIFSKLSDILKKMDYAKVDNFIDLTKNILQEDVDSIFSSRYFQSWWGRGQSYVHLTRVEN